MERPETLTLMTTDRIGRSLMRMAHEVNEQNRSDYPIVLFGINQRGFVVAEALGEALADITEVEISVEQLDLETDDGSDRPWKQGKYEKPHFIVLVDDVIFSGQTMFQALTITVGRLKPAEIYTAALIDRGHRKYPVKAEFYGLKMPTKLDEHVAVEVESGKLLEVRLIHQ